MTAVSFETVKGKINQSSEDFSKKHIRNMLDKKISLKISNTTSRQNCADAEYSKPLLLQKRRSSGDIIRSRSIGYKADLSITDEFTGPWFTMPYIKTVELENNGNKSCESRSKNTKQGTKPISLSRSKSLYSNLSNLTKSVKKSVLERGTKEDEDTQHENFTEKCKRFSKTRTRSLSNSNSTILKFTLPAENVLLENDKDRNRDRLDLTGEMTLFCLGWRAYRMRNFYKKNIRSKWSKLKRKSSVTFFF